MKKNKTKVIFILGSGRCGTYSFFKALKNSNRIEAYHEFFFEPTLRIATLYHMKKISKKKVIEFLKENHGFSITNSNNFFWIDSSNALPWITDVLVEVFPKAKFVHLIRNGKKVVSSFYNKHNDIMYNQNDVIKLKDFLQKKIKYLSSEKKYWRPIPINNMKELEVFLKKSQFAKICKYWSEINIKINDCLKKANKKKLFKMEDFQDKKKVLDLLNFIGINRNFYNIFQKSFKRPMNVTIPKNIYLSSVQKKIFQRECDSVMRKFNYDDNEYKTIY